MYSILIPVVAVDYIGLCSGTSDDRVFEKSSKNKAPALGSTSAKPERKFRQVGLLVLRLRARWRAHVGFDSDDWDAWHVAIYFRGRKRKGHIRVNPYFIHATEQKGVQINQISPGDFTNESSEVRTRMEIVRFEGIRDEQRKEIIDFSLSKIGLAFDWSVGKHARLTYAFGLPNVLHKRNEFSCQQLVIDAYAAAGIYFPHPYKLFPIFNIGRFLGHPLGHPKDRVDPMYPYLYDHHIYRDPRFKVKAILYEDPISGEIILKTKNLEKYSWNPEWKEKYLSRMNLDKG